MSELFSDLPEAILNIQEIIEKVEPIVLSVKYFSQSLTFLMNLLLLRIKRWWQKGREQILKASCKEGAKFRYGEISKRFKNELILIKRY